MARRSVTQQAPTREVAPQRVEQLVIDASIAIAWVHPAQATPQTTAVLDQIGQGVQVVVPALWPL